MIKKLLRGVREYKRDSLLAPAFVSIEVLIEVLIPFLMATLIDKGIDAGNMEVIWQLGLVLIVAAFVSLLFGVLAGKFAASASVGYVTNLRKDIYDNVQNFSFANIDKFSTSSIITRLTTDITNVQRAYQMIIRVAVRGPVMMIFALIMAFGVNKRLSLVFLLVIPILGGGLFYIMTHAHPIFERVFKIYDKLNTVVQENLRGIRVVKAYVREDHESEKFVDVSEDIYNNFTKAEKLLAFNAPLMQFSVYTCLILISWFGARLIVTSTMTTGQLVSLIAYATQILMSLMMLSMIFVMITISRASAERIVEIIDEESDLHNPDNPIYKVENGDITFENVSFSYGKDNKNYCLKNANIHINSGETIGVIGSTGSSKTTLVQLVPRLYDATQGRVLVGGEDVREYDIKTLRSEVSMVLQKNVIFSGTISENLRWGNKDATDEEITHASKLAMAHEFITSFPNGYETHIEQDGSNVSGGQKQRICIARALVKKPKILILDDSTSAVDTKTELAIRNAFLTEIPDVTKIIITQRIASVINTDKIIVMDDGEIKGFGTHDELMENNEIYQEAYYSQMKGGEKNE